MVPMFLEKLWVLAHFSLVSAGSDLQPWVGDQRVITKERTWQKVTIKTEQIAKKDKRTRGNFRDPPQKKRENFKVGVYD